VKVELLAMVERNKIWKRTAVLGDAMVMRWDRNLEVQDIRNHTAEQVHGLKTLLLRGTSLTPDPKHPGFFEIHNDAEVYYVHLVPNSGKVLLLATWSVAEQMASACCGA
jgi:hypothetical protein